MITIGIALAGGLGSTMRFIIDGVLRTVVGRIFPWSTIIINITGSLLLGLVSGFALRHAAIDSKLIWGTGFCGGYTTFSTAMYEGVRLIEERRYGGAVVHVACNLILTVAFYAVGFILLG